MINYTSKEKLILFYEELVEILQNQIPVETDWRKRKEMSEKRHRFETLKTQIKYLRVEEYPSLKVPQDK